jgi:hypothetical protein
MSIFVPKNTYIPILQGTRVCLHGSQARVKSNDRGPNHHLHNKMKKKTYLHPSLLFFAHKISISILEFTPHGKFQSLGLSESPITQAQFEIIFFPPCIDVKQVEIE